jgi:hypothetical protein
VLFSESLYFACALRALSSISVTMYMP